MVEKNADRNRLIKFALMIGGDATNDPSKTPQARRFGLFRSRKGVVVADIYNGAVRQTWPVQSKLFSKWLSAAYFDAEGKTATHAELKSAIDVIDAGGLRDLPVLEVFHRAGEVGDRLYLDLANENWEAIEIDANGWRHVQNPPVQFMRTPGMLPLPVPEKGGSIEMLRSLVNLDDEQDFVLVVAWLLAAMHRNITKPILAIRGGEGSAKSTLVEILRGLVDPYDPPYTALPRTDLKLRATASAAYCQVYDNVSGLPLPISDALCRFVTDGSNQPVILTGLSDIVTRPDLADRCLFIDCARSRMWNGAPSAT